ncbi:MAG: alpha/beta hydrolase [Candidatus Nanoarchaeia archaeon]
MNNKEIQVVYIHGAEIFATHEEYIEYLQQQRVKLTSFRKWNREYLKEELEVIAQFIRPNLPRGNCNPHYDEWEIFFTNLLKELNHNIILIGCSLGGIFLSKYLSKHKVDKNFISLYLVASPYEDESGAEEYRARNFHIDKDISKLYNNTNNITLMFSKDDDCVPISDMNNYKEKLPNAKCEVYESKNGHFIVEEFSELLEMIKQDIEKFNQE